MRGWRSGGSSCRSLRRISSRITRSCTVSAWVRDRKPSPSSATAKTTPYAVASPGLWMRRHAATKTFTASTGITKK